MIFDFSKSRPAHRWAQCSPVPARYRSVPVPPQERNGTISVLGGTERNDENRRNDETGRFVPKLALQEKWMENPLKCVKNPNFFACGACRHRRRYILRISFRKLKEKILKNDQNME